jgi:ATP-dependent DNA helicase RecQ
MAVTATATRRVQESIIDNLGMHEPQVLVGGFDRPNLHFSVIRCDKDSERDEKLLKALPKLCARGGSGLIYVSTRKQCEEVAALASRALAPHGLKAAAYHAGIDGASRNALQQSWLDGEAQVLVATNAFGMGIDKSDVRFVIHYGICDSLENYYQEAGRAGRDGRSSRVVILYRPGDKRVREFFIDNEGVESGDCAPGVFQDGARRRRRERSHGAA